MKVKELVEMLLQYDQEMSVLVRGYEYGYQTPESPKLMDMHKKSERPGVGGNYREHYDEDCFDCDNKILRCTYVVLDR